MHRAHVWHGLVCVACTLAFVVAAGSSAEMRRPSGSATQAAAQGNPLRPTAPPPDAPAPGSRCLGCGVAPDPIQPDDYTGWTSIFDGRTLENWDGNPEVWRVEDGAITAETWPDRRVGTTFIVWRGGEPADFELKLEVKADYDIHGGVFYRAAVGANVARGGGPGPGRATGVGRTGGAAPGRAAGAGGVTGRGTGAPAGRGAQAFAVPPDPRWNVRGYGIDWDWDPGNNGNVQDVGTGRAESQIGWRGHIVRTAAGERPRSIGTLGDRDELMKHVVLGEWNQLHVIAHGRQLTHIVNGHVMAVLIDDDPAAFKAKGVIALQIEQYGQGKISFRNIWLKQ